MGSIFSLYNRRSYVVPSSFLGPNKHESYNRYERHSLECNPEMNDNYEVVLSAVIRDPFELRFASPEMCNDPAIIYEAVKQNGYLLCYASKSLRDDDTIVRTALMNDPMGADSPFAFASERLKSNIDMCRFAYGYNKTAKEYFSPEILSILDESDKKEKIEEKHVSWEERSFS